VNHFRPLLLLAVLFHGAIGLPAAEAQPELLDRIVAVVDDQVVLWSELEVRTHLGLQQQGRNPLFLPEQELAGERRRVLDGMVDELVVIKKAQRDSIEVDPERVEEYLDAEFGRMRSSMAPGELEQLLERSGMTERQLKARERKRIRHQLLYEQMISTQAYRQFITRRDVDLFREAHRDSLPPKLSVSQINLKVAPADSVVERARGQIERIQQQLDSGEAFAAVARRLSEDPGTAAAGGDLGCFSPGTLMPDFERAAAELRPGERSDPVLTPFGYHLILLHEKRESEMCASHILVRARTTDDDMDRVRQRLEDLRRRAMAGEDFAQLARDHSEDPQSARQGGIWQILERDNLPPFLLPFLGHLGLGDVCEPMFLETGGHILKINDDHATLEALVRETMVAVRMEEIIADYRQQIHIEQRLDEDWLWDPIRTTDSGR
jgi:peptidyl-prolyl cis-trans isomerase SurA